MLPYATQLKNNRNNWSITVADATKEFQDHERLFWRSVAEHKPFMFCLECTRNALGLMILTSYFLLFVCLPAYLAFRYFVHLFPPYHYDHHYHVQWCDNENSMFWTTTVCRTKLGMDMASYVSVTDLMWSNRRNNENNFIFVFLNCIAFELSCWFWTTVNTLL